MKTTSKLCAGLAVAFAMSAGEASAVTVFKNVGTLLQAGGGAYSGQIDITSYLAGGAYKVVNAKVTALGSSSPTTNRIVTSPTSPVLVDQQARVTVPAHWASDPNCGSIFGCPAIWVPDTVVYDSTFETFRDDRTFDLVKDVLRLDVGEAVGLDTVDQTFSEGPYSLGFTDTVGSSASGYFYYKNYVRYVTDVWAGPITSAAVLSLNDLDALNADGLLDFALDVPVGKVGVSQLKLEFDLASAVPEPATWAMILIGFVGLGSALRARRRQGLAI